MTYDALRRPVDSYVDPPAASEILLSRTIYGEALASPQATNHRGRVYRNRTYDGGQSTIPAYDFRGLPTSSEVRLMLAPSATNDWTAIAGHATIAAMATAAVPVPESTVHTASSTYDASAES